MFRPSSFKLDMDSLCISYVSASATNFFFSKGSGKKKRKREYQRHRSSTPTTPVSGEAGGTPEVSDDDENNVHVDIADIVEVREGFATDTFNEAAKSAESLKISTFLKVKEKSVFLFSVTAKLSFPPTPQRPKTASRLSSLRSSVAPALWIWCLRTRWSPKVGSGPSIAF